MNTSFNTARLNQPCYSLVYREIFCFSLEIKFQRVATIVLIYDFFYNFVLKWEEFLISTPAQTNLLHIHSLEVFFLPYISYTMSIHTLQSSVPPDAQVHRFQLTLIIIPFIQKKHVLVSSLISLCCFVRSKLLDMKKENIFS